VFHRVALFTTLLTLVVVVLGAYVRLSDAGLGCPDWPGCYGQLSVPEAAHDIAKASQAFPGQTIEAAKAWKEMIHRYVASTLGVLVLILAVLAWRQKRAGHPVLLPSFLVVLIIFQALLGMWTVTLLLKPVVVMGHLLGGMSTLACLSWLTLRSHPRRRNTPTPDTTRFKGLALAALFLVVAQIALGGWTSANYAALVCLDFPACQAGQDIWPETNFADAFAVQQSGLNYEGGVLGQTARATIHMTHRLGALLVFICVAFLALRLFFASHSLRHIGLTLGGFLSLQIGLGIANVVYVLPLPVAVAHNAVAACLLVTLVWLNHCVRPNNAYQVST